MRLDKYLCQSTELTRSEAKKYLKQKRVTVNQRIVTQGSIEITEHDKVTLDNEVLHLIGTRYIMLHKPQDTLCSNIDELYPSVLHFVDLPRAFELIIAGRLDADTTGLVLLTDDGKWAHRVASPKQNCMKTYRVGLANKLAEQAIEQLETGVQLHGEKSLTKPATVQVISDQEILLSISEGKYHQVKRMIAAVGNRVETLHRESIGNIKLDEQLALGQWRYLTAEEIAEFNN
jgi:16S rRNA pseudouridine516 synthase